MPTQFNLSQYGIEVTNIIRNASPAVLYEEAIKYDKGAAITSSGALAISSGVKTGRSPKDKRIVEHPESKQNIWWGSVNAKIDEPSFLINRERAIDYFNTLNRLYVFDGFAGWDANYRIKVRVICSRAYHALFMHNMLIRPSEMGLEEFGEPNYVILNAGCFPADSQTPYLSSKTSVNLNFEKGEFVILGTQYAGEMKKGVFTVMNYIMPQKDILSMHCSANEGEKGDLTLFFGLSGTGKTTLSADLKRKLIGDDEHCWSEDGIFNIEGGCYAKCIDLTEKKEPQIYNAIRFGTIVENIVYDKNARTVNYSDSSITQNTRASYPIEHINNAKIPCVGKHPKNIIFLTCDAFGVLPPVSKLTPEQAMYHFISGYTAKVAGTEVDVTEPQATFSACFGAAFLVWHPGKYARMLAQKMEKHNAKAWLINTGWSKGPYGVGSRIKLLHTRSIIDAIHEGKLDEVETVKDAIFGLEIPTSCPGVPEEILQPRGTWENPEKYDEKSKELAKLFIANFEEFKGACKQDIIDAGPSIEENKEKEE